MECKFISTADTIAIHGKDERRIYLYVRTCVDTLIGHATELKEFLGAEHIENMTCMILKKEEGAFGYVLKLSFQTDTGNHQVYVKLRYSLSAELDLYRTVFWTRPIITDKEEHGEWVQYKFEENERTYTKWRRNPTQLEYEMTLEASAFGLMPPSRVIADMLLIQGIPSGTGVSLNDLPGNGDMMKAFMRAQKGHMKMLGRTYGLLNKKLHILHGDVDPAHIFFIREGYFQLIDLSTLSPGYDGPISQRIGPGEAERVNDLQWLYGTIGGWMGQADEIQRWCIVHKVPFARLQERYWEWIKEGFDSVTERSRRIRQNKMGTEDMPSNE